MNAKELAKLVLEMMDVQQRYFTARKVGNPSAGTILNEAKRIESHVKKTCKEIMKPNSDQVSMF